jgi:hypothetical protein
VGISAVLKDERGDMLARLGRVYVPLASRDDAREFPILGHVDPYGRTIDNRGQMRTLQTELQRIRDASSDVESTRAELIRLLLDICAEGVEHPHRFLWFLGD